MSDSRGESMFHCLWVSANKPAERVFLSLINVFRFPICLSKQSEKFSPPRVQFGNNSKAGTVRQID